jgi:hypothetical protein
MRNKKLVLKTAKIQEMSGQDVQRVIGKDKFQAIKSRDGHPFFVELLVAHEGVSRGKILAAGQNSGAGGTKKFWSRGKVEELARKLKSKSVPVYLFHDCANRPRRKVGEIVYSLTKEVLGRFSALAYAYISDPEVRGLIRSQKLDTCSLEADLVFERDEKNGGAYEWIVNAVEAVSGLALGSKKISRPGFPGAAILAQVEEFEDAGDGFEESEKIKEQAEAELKVKENELEKLKAELANLQKEREREERKRKVVEIVDKHMADRNLKREERRLVVEEVSERMELKEPRAEELERAVKDELDRELGRLAELRRLYQKSSPAPAPLESGEDISKNPLIPKD